MASMSMQILNIELYRIHKERYDGCEKNLFPRFLHFRILRICMKNKNALTVLWYDGACGWVSGGARENSFPWQFPFIKRQFFKYVCTGKYAREIKIHK
jgi:hypothetical protein